MYFRTGNPKGLTESGSGELGIIVCGRVPWLYQYWPVPWLYQYWLGGFMLLLVLCPGTPGGIFVCGRVPWLYLEELMIHIKDFDCQCTF